MTTNLNISELDFSRIKSAFTTYLSNQTEFSDYNFEGSALSVILDIFAYATHYTGSYTNFAFAETFLDSAIKRGSVVSRAKELGYTPRSYTAPSASITISFSVSGNPSQYILPKNTKFTNNEHKITTDS